MNARMRDRYLSDSVTTATPGDLLVRLYDRLIVDLQRGEAAIVAGEAATRNEMLTHAQDIITELHATLDVSAWSGGPGLAQIYEFSLHELVQANIAADAGRVAAVRELLEPLRDAWREAAKSGAPTTPAVVATG